MHSRNLVSPRTVAGVLLIVFAVTAINAVSGPPTSAPHAHERFEYSNELLVQLAVRDLDQSMTFYRDVLGLRLITHTPELEWAKFETNVPGVQIGIGRQPIVSGSGTVSINIGVRDLDKARRVLSNRGVDFPKPSINIPGVVKLADFTDPDGNRLRLAGPPDAGDVPE